MSGIHIVEGKPTLSAHLMALGIKKSGRYDYRVCEHSNERCTVVFRERAGSGWEEIGRTTYTIEDARHAGLASKGLWQKYARSMLFARALSEGYRTHCPDALGVTGPTYVEGEIEGAAEPPLTVEAQVVPVPPAPAPEPEIPSSPRDKWRERRDAIRARVDALDAESLTAEDEPKLRALLEQLPLLSAQRLAKAEAYLDSLTQPEPTAGAAPSTPMSPATPAPPPASSVGGGGAGLSSADSPEQGEAEVEAAVERAKERRALVARQAAEGSMRAQLEQAQQQGTAPPREEIPDPGAQPARRASRRGKAVTPETVAEALQAAPVAGSTRRLEEITGDREGW